MSFNSLLFIYCFLPVTGFVFFLARKISLNAAHIWIVFASAVFYALGDAAGFPILGASIIANYLIGKSLSQRNSRTGNWIFGCGISLNILCLAFFKYAHQLIPSAGTFFFPLAISFYTFSQISYLAELHQGKINQPRFLEYLVYILFFPKLIAGPITRPTEFLLQLADGPYGKYDVSRILKGITFFCIGLFKKTIIADQLAPYSDGLFQMANTQTTISFYHAWSGMITYGMQLYFDFSGYTDMAIGAALILGIMLPINFDSPYKSASITEFWRRWHMTLSFFFRDYVYIPLGGSRKGPFKKYVNLMIVMVLCGMWHGSPLTFAIWGAMHGFYLIIHNLWISLKTKLGLDPTRKTPMGVLSGRIITFIAVTAAWVPFRANSLSSARYLLTALADLPSSLPNFPEVLLFCLIALPPLLIAVCLPPAQSWMRYIFAKSDQMPGEAVEPVQWWQWKENLRYGLCVGIIAVIGVMSITENTTFIYKGF